ncbi:hypothetical protein FRX31_025271 [Thalictrum thalictroides]|uniref:Uncharacterized protein n=1 Tax=Thalictrum thalictroides TaxID=46969 RepID=A0A7J6VLV4_THATH|nr:hypothetical protein FRX31_025271 [Thalictrum thalictroides]
MVCTLCPRRWEEWVNVDTLVDSVEPGHKLVYFVYPLFPLPRMPAPKSTASIESAATVIFCIPNFQCHTRG